MKKFLFYYFLATSSNAQEGYSWPYTQELFLAVLGGGGGAYKMSGIESREDVGTANTQPLYYFSNPWKRFFWKKALKACSLNLYSPLNMYLAHLPPCSYACLFPCWRSSCSLSNMCFSLSLPSSLPKWFSIKTILLLKKGGWGFKKYTS